MERHTGFQRTFDNIYKYKVINTINLIDWLCGNLRELSI